MNVRRIDVTPLRATGISASFHVRGTAFRTKSRLELAEGAYQFFLQHLQELAGGDRQPAASTHRDASDGTRHRGVLQRDGPELLVLTGSSCDTEISTPFLLPASRWPGATTATSGAAIELMMSTDW
jgi:hypothetical protein